MNKVKKEKGFTMRIDEDLLNSFQSVAKQNDRTASQLIRDFMRDYIRKNAQADLFSQK